MPVNDDEMIELRALNDVPTSDIKAIPAAATAARCIEGMRVDQLLGVLRRLINRGEPLKEDYAVERVLMALLGGQAVDVRVAASALAVLSAGSVDERLEAMFDLLAQPEAEVTRTVSRLPADRLPALLAALMRTGQIPPEKFVRTEDEGKNALGISRSWYQIQPVSEYTPEEWSELLLRGQYANATLLPEPAVSAPAASAESQVEGAESAARRVQAATSVDLEQFKEMMLSDLVCVWGQCRRLAEMRRAQKQREETEEYQRNPPFYQRAWTAVTGRPP